MEDLDVKVARVEESMKVMAPRVERIEIKLDHLIEKSSFRWGMVIGVSGIVSLLIQTFWGK